MMTMKLRIALILVSLATFCLIIRRIRQSKVQIESAIFWILLRSEEHTSELQSLSC